MAAVRRIDSHVHVWKVERQDYFWMTPDQPQLYRDFGLQDLQPLLDLAGVERVVLVQAAPTVAETEFLLGVAEEAPIVAGVTGWADLEADDLPAVLDRLGQHDKLKAVRPMIQDIDDPDWMLSDAVGHGLQALIRAELAFEFLVRPLHLPHVRKVLDAHPDLRAVIDHGAKPQLGGGAHDAWASEMALLARDTSVYCKLSGLATEAGRSWQSGVLEPCLDHLLEHFGPRRLMFGSDWPIMTLITDYPEWFHFVHDWLANRCPESVDRVFGQNAVDFYGLQE